MVQKVCVSIVFWLIICVSAGQRDAITRNRHRQRPNPCGHSQFACSSGSCISATYKCDGRIDCPDGSDETLKTCISTHCPAFAFRCDYGGCINARKVCDGVKDCVDESDEDVTRCRPSQIPSSSPTTSIPDLPQASGATCTVSEYPNDGVLLLAMPRSTFTIIVSPGFRAAESTMLKEQCNQGFIYEGSANYMECSHGQWSRQVGKCIRRACEPIHNTSTVRVACTKRNLPVSCLEATEGTEATFECVSPQEFTLSGQRSIHCTGGRWNQDPGTCIPVKNKVVNVFLNVNIYQKQSDTGNYVPTFSVSNLTALTTNLTSLSNKTLDFFQD